MITKQAKEKPHSLSRFIPILHWLPRYHKEWLAGDILAGLSVWALMVPQSLGFAAICGVPVQYGLYAAAIALIVYAIFASSRHVVTGPSSTIAAVTGAAALSVTKAGSSEAIALVAAITLLVGFLYIILSILRMGWVSNFLAESVLVGFVFGIGIDVAVGQLRHVTGTHVTGESVWQKLASWIASLPQTSSTTLVVGVAALLILFALKIYAPRVPGALVTLVLGIAASAIFNFADQGVAVVGKVPRGLPLPVPPDISIITKNLGLIITGAIGVLLVGFSESLAAARQYASKYHYGTDINQEMLAQGMANVSSGIFQGINVAGSLSKSSVNDASGAKSEMSSLAQGFFVLLTLLIIAPLFADLPEAVLGAIVIQAVVTGLMDVKAMKRIYRLNRTEFWVGSIALLGVLTFGTLQGVLIGLFLSLMVLVARSSKPNIPVLGRSSGTDVFHSLDQYPDSETYPGLVIIRFDGPLYFATANALRDKVRAVTTDTEPPATMVLIDMEGVNYLDLEGADMLKEIAENMKSAGVEIHLARVKHEVMQML
ncbi:MAG: sulfate permease [Deltaproteobacteria bacterium]|jgi:high affinity sulfate transporter 1|nr:sulfate permease [Deltaproteobacteria bacterium]